MRIRSPRFRLQVRMLAVISAAMIATIVGIGNRTPFVVYNASGSAPLGFYRLEGRLPQRGETAVVAPPPLVELMLIAREILPVSVPLIKQIAAAGGDEVCRSDDPNGTISVNGQVVAETFEKDRHGRPLPAWKGCMRLTDGEFFLLQPHPYSFDSRYFGPVTRCDVLGVAHPIWTWNPDG
jgi:conjugative transfer signal peptidase TraF